MCGAFAAPISSAHLQLTAIKGGIMTKSLVEGIIRQHIGDKQFCVKRLALMLHISNSHLRKIVHQLFHVSPRRLIQRIRMEIASRLLAEHEKIQVVARLVGYGSDRAFRGAFRRDKGMAPKAFQKLSPTP